MEKFEIICKLCGLGNVEVKATAIQYGIRTRCKLRRKSCGMVEELDLEEASTNIADFLSLGGEGVKQT